VALKDIENTDAPLFLKFVNLLVNDANFLLGEALDVSMLAYFNTVHQTQFFIM